MSLYRRGTASRKLTQGLLICGITLAPLFFAVLIIQFFGAFFSWTIMS